MAQRTRTKIAEVAGARSTEPIIEVHRQNREERIRRTGTGVELVRQVYAKRLQIQFAAFCEHGALADLVVLSAVLNEYESRLVSVANAQDRALLLESLLKVLCVSPEGLLSD